LAIRAGGGSIGQALETAMSAASLVVRGLGSRGQSQN
jgi:hypothetical protein